MKQIQVTKTTRKSARPELDLRSPSGRPLPY
jgi:hypothetical protein